MDDNTQKTVVSITSHRANTQSRVEIDGARRCISMLTWDLQVQQALAMCSLSVSEALLNDEMVLPPSSHAAQVGHTSLQSLVSKSEVEDGFNMDWVDFKAKVHAVVYRSKYSIEESNFAEINAMVADVTKILGRMPATAAEFHSAKQSVLEATIHTLHREHKTRMDDLQDRNNQLMRDLNTEKATVTELRTNNKSLMEESQSRIQQMTRELAVKQDGYEREAKASITTEVQKAEAAFKLRLGEAQTDMEALIREAQNERREAEMMLSAVTRRIEAGELIESSKLLELNLKIESARDVENTLREQMLKLNDELTQANKRVELIQDDNRAKFDVIETMKAHVEMLEQRLREQVEDKLGASEFAVLNERLEIRKQEIETLQAMVEKLTLERDAGYQDRDMHKENFTLLRGRFAEMRGQGSKVFAQQAKLIQDIRAELAEFNMKYANLASSKTQLKLYMIGLGTIAGMASLALGLLIHNM
jgi:chromosome segregation ATPase